MSCLSDRSGGGIWVKWPKKPRNGSISENNDGLQVGVAASRLQKKILRLKTKSSSSSGLSSRLRKRMFNKTMLLKLEYAEVLREDDDFAGALEVLIDVLIDNERLKTASDWDSSRSGRCDNQSGLIEDAFTSDSSSDEDSEDDDDVENLEEKDPTSEGENDGIVHLGADSYEVTAWLALYLVKVAKFVLASPQLKAVQNEIVVAVRDGLDDESSTAKDGLPRPKDEVGRSFLVTPGRVWLCPWSCGLCSGVLMDPVTLPCGHTFCRSCLLKRNANATSSKSKATCYKCGFQWFPMVKGGQGEEVGDFWAAAAAAAASASSPSSLPVSVCSVKDALLLIKTNVSVNKLCGKYWLKDREALQHRNEGNEHFNQKRIVAAIQSYTRALTLVPEEYCSISNRSQALLTVGRNEEALKDALDVVRMRPDWAKGYFKAGCALRSLGRHEEAFKAFFECLSIELACASDVRKVALETSKELLQSLSEMVKDAGRISASKKSQSYSNVVDPNNSDGGGDNGSVSSGGSSCASNRSSNLNCSIAGVINEDSTSSSSFTEPSFRSKSSPHLTFGKAAGTSICPGNRGVSHNGVLSNQNLSALPKWLDCLMQWLREPETKSSSDAMLANDSRLWCLRGLYRYRGSVRPIDQAEVDASDYECPLCLRILWQPITTLCGHTFCRVCLDRALDHNNVCPMCKSPSIRNHLIMEGCEPAVDEFIEASMRRLIPKDYDERENLHKVEMTDLGGGSVHDHNIPVFVCTISLPTIACPLHVFEPRYRFMVRRAMESGTREFGMCCGISSQQQFSDYGTMMEIRDVKYFPDGRSIIDTVGGRRFKVMDRGCRDGYDTAKVKFIADKVPEDASEELALLQIRHNAVLGDARNWFCSMMGSIKEGIVTHYGPFPDIENEYWKLPNGPSWTWWLLTVLPLDAQTKIHSLSQASLLRRLELIDRVLRCLSRRASVFTVSDRGCRQAP